MFIRRYIDKNIDQALSKDLDPLSNVRAKFLAYSLSVSLIVLVVTMPSFFMEGRHLLFFRSLLITFFQIGLIWVLLSTTRWKLVAHLACSMVALLIWSNLFVFLEGIKIISLQFMLLLIVMSYYLLGNKWGIFYSLVSILFMTINFSFYGQNAMIASANSAETDSFSFLVIFSFNFLLLIYLQYHFFNAFNSTIKQLNTKQQEEALLNNKLKEAIVVSDQLSKAKSNFLSTISHELRTPLNGVIGMSNVLILDSPREDQKENLNILKFSANNLMNLINAVLDINKIESGKIEIEKAPFKIFNLANNIYLTFKDRAERKGLNFNLIINNDLHSIGIIGDQTRLTQILSNLLENAVKFTKTGAVNFSIKLIEKQDNEIKLQFCISDTGIGIPADKQELVFESFAQASTSTTRNYGGTGLGLAIVKNLLELHDSTIIIKSELNIGTSFTFDICYNLFNFDTQEHTKPTYKIVEDMDISELKILIAEDNQMNILLMRKLLAKWNISPDFAANGSEAVEAFKIKDYDLILMDIHMPVMDGYEASIIIRNFTDKEKATVPIIALTASVAMDVRNKITDAGINDFVSKPFSPDELKAKLEQIALQKA